MRKKISILFFFLVGSVLMGCADFTWISQPSIGYSPTEPEEILVFESSRLPSQPYETIGEVRYSKFLGSYETLLETIKERAAGKGTQGIIVLDSDQAVRWGAQEGLFHFGSSSIKASLIRFKEKPPDN